MNIFNIFAERLRAIVQELGVAEPEQAARIVVEPPRDSAHGDLATNAALVLAKDAGRKPRDLAAEIAEALGRDPDVGSVEVAGPGFINLRLAGHVRGRILAAILEAGTGFGRADIGAGTAINVEYVSANPTGPMHVGHCRGAVVGDALAGLLAFAGWQVTREYYVNDAGAQVDTLARSAYLRYREALGETIGEIPAGLYPGDYLVPVGRALAGRHGRELLDIAEEAWLPVVRREAIDAMMAMIRDDLAALGIAHDVFFSEDSLTGNGDLVAAAIEKLAGEGMIYRGVLPPPKGQVPEDWEDREQTLFRSTAFGDDMDRPLMKSDGRYTYFAADIAYHYDKIRRGFTQMVDVLGADHGGYVKRMKAAVTALSGGRSELDVLLCQLVTLLRGGEPVKMSKRSGDFVTLREVVDEVGPDAVRFMMLFRKSDAPLDFDFEKVTEQSRDNPVFYVQYGHARTASVRRQAGREAPEVDVSAAALATARFDLLADGGERDLVTKLAEWPRVVESAAVTHEPHRIAFYLHDLASAFHAHWNRGKDNPDLRFIKPDEPQLTAARLALVTAVQTVLANGLGVLGVCAPSEMR